MWNMNHTQKHAGNIWTRPASGRREAFRIKRHLEELQRSCDRWFNVSLYMLQRSVYISVTTKGQQLLSYTVKTTFNSRISQPIRGQDSCSSLIGWFSVTDWVTADLCFLWTISVYCSECHHPTGWSLMFCLFNTFYLYISISYLHLWFVHLLIFYISIFHVIIFSNLPSGVAGLCEGGGGDAIGGVSVILQCS